MLVVSLLLLLVVSLLLMSLVVSLLLMSLVVSLLLLMSLVVSLLLMSLAKPPRPRCCQRNRIARMPSTPRRLPNLALRVSCPRVSNHCGAQAPIVMQTLAVVAGGSRLRLGEACASGLGGEPQESPVPVA